MHRFVRRFRRPLALAAAFVTGVAPVLAYAHPAVGAGGGYAEVCTDAGLTRVPSDGDERPLAHPAHCVLCPAPSGVFAPGRAAPPLAAIGRAERPLQVTPQAPAPIEPVRAARPRGPPARSARSA
jgi:hypothetical protein